VLSAAKSNLKIGLSIPLRFSRDDGFYLESVNGSEVEESLFRCISSDNYGIDVTVLFVGRDL